MIAPETTLEAFAQALENAGISVPTEELRATLPDARKLREQANRVAQTGGDDA